MKHEWIIKFLKLYIKDPNIIGLVKKYLKVGVLDNGELMVNEEGSAQGNVISLILANIYMHNVLTLWYKFIITKECKGDNFLIVYADDFVAGFQYKWEAENYYKLLKERMEKFSLQLEDSKVVSYKAVLILQGQSKRAVSVSDYKHLIFWNSHSIVGVHAKACHI